ncbi:MAG: hypothetical protein JWP34_2237 [Massilia sp.]|jgi:hypothetical protein|nr:hypothetical protein [Massilia sp.]
MLWDCVCSGIAVLSHWQTYVAALFFLSLSMGPKFLLGAVTVSSPSGHAAMKWVSVLCIALGQVVGIAIFVTIMCPIMLGLSLDASWSLPFSFVSRDPCAAARFCGGLLFIAIVLAWTPVIGQSRSFSMFVVGSMVLVGTFGLVITTHGVPPQKIQYWPGLLFTIALFSVGTALTWLGTMLAMLFATAIERHVQGAGKLIAYPAAAAAGFIPLFMYSAWLGHQIQLS